jgi:hypothetical protein
VCTGFATLYEFGVWLKKAEQSIGVGNLLVFLHAAASGAANMRGVLS